MNSLFEEVSGIRQDSSAGEYLTSACRDQAFSALCADLFDRVQPGTEGATEDFEFSGVNYKVNCVAFGPLGSPQGYAISVLRGE